MKALVAGFVLVAAPTAAFAVFSVGSAPEPGALELVALGSAALVVARLLKRNKKK